MGANDSSETNCTVPEVSLVKLLARRILPFAGLKIPSNNQATNVSIKLFFILRLLLKQSRKS